MKRRNHELWMALIAIFLILALYLVVMTAFKGAPRASGFFGHTIGIIGFLLMLMTETLYSLRKRSRRARWGRMANWLDFHIFTGIVGPFMVLLHTAWKFNGLAGVLTLFMVIVVASGFIGRYIYTAIPRTSDGAEIEADQAGKQTAALASARRRLALWHTVHIPLSMVLFSVALIHIVAALYYATLMK